MFRDVRKGDRVYSLEYGWGMVTALDNSDFPIFVDFKYEEETFALDGKVSRASIHPTLFWDEVKIEIPKKPLPDLEVDTRVLVWTKKGGKKIKRYFKRFNEDGAIECFMNGATSWTSNGAFIYECWELAENNTEDKK